MKKLLLLAGVCVLAVSAYAQPSNTFPASVADANVGYTELQNNSYGTPLKPGFRGAGDRFLFYNNSTYKTAIGMLEANGVYIQATGGNTTPLLQLWSGTTGGGDISAKYTFTMDGKLGMGVTSPVYQVTLAGSGEKIGVYSDATHYNFIEFYNSSTGGMNFDHYTAAGGGYNWSFNGVKQVTFASDGNVGIGTTTPAEKLSVNGKIRAHEVKVETANWPDYVFEEGYKVEKLEELESYIKANKHLPGIPSAKEVEKEGISLGEMNAKLLEKIEELTIYVIEQNKILTGQQKQIDELKNKRWRNK